MSCDKMHIILELLFWMLGIWDSCFIWVLLVAYFDNEFDSLRKVFEDDDCPLLLEIFLFSPLFAFFNLLFGRW